MARMTAAERKAVELAQRQAAEKEFAATYPTRLLALLARACADGMELSVREFNDGMFEYVVSYTDRWGDSTNRKFLQVANFSSYEAMDELTWALDGREEARREEQRKTALRLTALAKLTKEEREELGL